MGGDVASGGKFSGANRWRRFHFFNVLPARRPTPGGDRWGCGRQPVRGQQSTAKTRGDGLLFGIAAQHAHFTLPPGGR